MAKIFYSLSSAKHLTSNAQTMEIINASQKEFKIKKEKLI